MGYDIDWELSRLESNLAIHEKMVVLLKERISKLRAIKEPPAPEAPPNELSKTYQ
jgi:hypothetical protein